jgi:hemerythrin-like domain-containing protein
VRAVVTRTALDTQIIRDRIERRNEMLAVKGPIRSFFHVHKAIRTELSSLADQVEKLDVGSDFSTFGDKVSFLSDVVQAHAGGEEKFLYPAVDELRRDVSNAYRWDHKVDEEYFQEIKDCIARLKTTREQSDLEGLKRNVHALHSFLSAHAQKEDDLLMPLIDSEVSPEKQGEMVGRISAHIPPELMERMLKWMVGIFTVEEGADFLGIVQSGAPSERFAVMMEWVRETLPARDWEELLEKMPDLA